MSPEKSSPRVSTRRSSSADVALVDLKTIRRSPRFCNWANAAVEEGKNSSSASRSTTRKVKSTPQGSDLERRRSSRLCNSENAIVTVCEEQRREVSSTSSPSPSKKRKAAATSSDLELLRRRSPRFGNASLTVGEGSPQPQSKRKPNTVGEDSPQPQLKWKPKMVSLPNSRSKPTVPSQRKKGTHIVSFFVGDTVPEEEARTRWPWRYEHQERKGRWHIVDHSEDEEDRLVLDVKCHYLQAEVEKCIFNLGDYAYVKGENGREHYIGRIIEFFKTNDDHDYFRVQWFFRAEDTVMKEAAAKHDKKRLFYSQLMNDNLLDCIVSKLKVIEIKLNDSKSRFIPACDFYYDMEYLLDYSTFCKMKSDIPSSHPSSCMKIVPMDVTLPDYDKLSGDKPCKSELLLLDMYSGCGGMSTGLCLGAKLCGLDLVTRWALDIDKSACEALKLNHPETQIRNESAEDFLYLLKEWDKLCKQYDVKVLENIPRRSTRTLRRAQDGIPSKTDEKIPSGEYEVEKLVDICYSDLDGTNKRGLKFQVRWVGYGPSEDTWEAMENLSKCEDRIRDFIHKGSKAMILPRPGDVGVICGGPPCQGISGYNRFRNCDSPMDDERNRQIIVFMDIVNFLKPKYVLMENVVDILKFAKGSLGRYALSRLVQMNYQARLGIMAAGCYGLPQFRLRAFLWGANPHENLPPFPLPTHDVVLRYGAPVAFERNIVAYDEGQKPKLEKAVVLRDAISDLPPVSHEAAEEMSYGSPPETEFQKYIRASEFEMLGLSCSGAKKIKKSVLYDHRPYPLNEDDYLRVCRIPHQKGANFRNLPGVIVDENNVVQRDPSTAILLPSGKPLIPDWSLTFENGKSSRPYARVWWDETVPTVLCKPDCHCQAVLHPEQDRVLTVREIARLQGFPDYYKFSGTIKKRYSQIGNAVPVPVARALGFALGLAVQKLCNNNSLITLPSKFSHSTATDLLKSLSHEDRYQECGSTASTMLPGLVSEDLSQGQEEFPIPATNLFDYPNSPLAPGFTYLKHIQIPNNIDLPPNAPGCKCEGDCTDRDICSCAQLNGSDFPYVDENGGRLVEAQDVVYECGPNCGCGPMCVNRTSQRGITHHLEVFRTPNKGWAVRSRDFIPCGAPVCEYAGVLRKNSELDGDSENDYLFDIDCWHTIKEIGGRERRFRDVSIPISNQLEELPESSPEPEFCIDAGSSGNVARFINHSCEPNLFVQCILSSHRDVRLAQIVLFASDDIPPLQELTYDYGYALDSVIGPDGEIKQMPCYCGEDNCRKRLY